jgi:hypothetical protein
MNFLALFLLQGLHQKLDNKSCFSWRILENLYFWMCSVRGNFTLYSHFFMLLTVKRFSVMKQDRTAKTVGWTCVLHHF